MKIQKNKNEYTNQYTISGLTMGKLIAIQNALIFCKEYQEKTDEYIFGPVKAELLNDFNSELPPYQVDLVATNK